VFFWPLLQKIPYGDYVQPVSHSIAFTGKVMRPLPTIVNRNKDMALFWTPQVQMTDVGVVY